MLLQRVRQSEEGTFGELFLDGDEVRIAVTCEPPPGDNQHNTCIPAGTYHVTQYLSPTKGRVFLLAEVPGRLMIEIHAGNTIRDTKGCILPGVCFGRVDGLKAVAGSKATMAELLEQFPQPFWLQIKDPA